MLMPSFAQAAEPHPLDNLFSTVTSVFSRVDTLAHPGNVVQALTALSVVWAVVFLIVGLMCLFNGSKFYKAATIMLAALIGVFAGYMLGQAMKIDAPYVVAGCLGVLLAVVAWPLMKYAVAVLGGLAGAFVGANVWTSVAILMENPEAVRHHWVGALMGLIVCGMLSFIVFNLSIVLLTSVSGATLAVLGALALLLNVQALRPSIESSLTSHGIIIPMLVLVPAVIGLILQEAWGGTGAKPGVKPGSGGGGSAGTAKVAA